MDVGMMMVFASYGWENIGECLAFGRVSGRNAAAETAWD